MLTVTGLCCQVGDRALQQIASDCMGPGKVSWETESRLWAISTCKGLWEDTGTARFMGHHEEPRSGESTGREGHVGLTHLISSWRKAFGSAGVQERRKSGDRQTP